MLRDIANVSLEVIAYLILFGGLLGLLAPTVYRAVKYNLQRLFNKDKEETPQ